MDCVFYVHSVLSPHNYSLRPGHWPKRTKLNQEWLSPSNPRGRVVAEAPTLYLSLRCCAPARPREGSSLALRCPSPVALSFTRTSIQAPLSPASTHTALGKPPTQSQTDPGSNSSSLDSLKLTFHSEPQFPVCKMGTVISVISAC